MTKEQAIALTQLQKQVEILRNSFLEAGDLKGAQGLANYLLTEGETLAEEIEAYEGD